MEPKEEATVCARAAGTLSQPMTKSTDLNELRTLEKGLSALTTRMEPREAVAVLSQAMSKARDGNQLHMLAIGVSAVAARMESKEAAAVCARAADLLSQAIV